MRNAVVIKTHFCNEQIVSCYERLRTECPPDFDVFIALNSEDSSTQLKRCGAVIEEKSLFLCNRETLLRLPYPEKCRRDGWKLNPGNTDLIMLAFIREHPDFDYYWGIEYDVHFVGNWSTLMERFRDSPADLLTTTIYRHSRTPMRNLRTPPFKSPKGQEYSREKLLKCFLPIYRLSRRGAAVIHEAYCDGCGGHYEVTWATILEHSGLALEDFGGDGSWVRPENRNRFYFNTPSTPSLSPGTFVYRWVFEAVPSRTNTLWHPVKPAGAVKWYSEPGNRTVAGMLRLAKQYISRLVIGAWFMFRWRPLKD